MVEMNEGARRANDRMHQQDIANKLDRIINLLEHLESFFFIKLPKKNKTSEKLWQESKGISKD